MTLVITPWIKADMKIAYCLCQAIMPLTALYLNSLLKFLASPVDAKFFEVREPISMFYIPSTLQSPWYCVGTEILTFLYYLNFK